MDLKKIVIIGLISLLIGIIIPSIIVSAIEICGEEENPVGSCRIITPQINCSEYNFTIRNSLGNITNQSNLSNLYGNYYYTDISLRKGTYFIEICDGNSREIIVEESGSMLIAIIIGLLGIPLLLLFFASQLGKDNDGNISQWNTVLKLFSLILFVGFLPIITNLCIELSKGTEYNSTFILANKVVIGFVILFFVILFIYLLTLAFEKFTFWKKDKREKWGNDDYEKR